VGWHRFHASGTNSTGAIGIMPEYHFRLEDERVGACVDLPDLEAAQLSVKYLARSLAADCLRGGALRSSQLVFIEDAAGTKLGSIALTDAIRFG
jgi:hypothetical protein